MGCNTRIHGGGTKKFQACEGGNRSKLARFRAGGVSTLINRYIEYFLE